MERITIFKVRPGLAKLFIIIGIPLTATGLFFLINSLITGFNFSFPSGDWNAATFSIQGLLFISMGFTYLKSRKYFIEWNDSRIRFLLPGQKKTEEVRFDQIISVAINLFEIELKLSNSDFNLNLENLQFEDLKKLKKKFELIDKMIHCKDSPSM